MGQVNSQPDGTGAPHVLMTPIVEEPISLLFLGRGEGKGGRENNLSLSSVSSLASSREIILSPC
jgi:hypothetical protein